MEILCWGGPEHGKVANVPDYCLNRGVVTFPVKPRSPVYTGGFNADMCLLLPKVDYKVRRIYESYPIYTVLIYAEDEERLFKNLIDTLNTIFNLFNMI